MLDDIYSWTVYVQPVLQTEAFAAKPWVPKPSLSPMASSAAATSTSTSTSEAATSTSTSEAATSTSTSQAACEPNTDTDTDTTATGKSDRPTVSPDSAAMPPATFLDPNAELRAKSMAFIQRVEFVLHKSFEPSLATAEEAPFEVTRQGWGGFPMKIRIFNTSGRVLEVVHNLVVTAPAAEKTISINMQTGKLVRKPRRPALPPTAWRAMKELPKKPDPSVLKLKLKLEAEAAAEKARP